MDEKQLKLSEEDINLIVDRVSARIEANLYQNVGRGLIQLAVRGVIIGLIILAAYGAGIKNWFH